MDPSSDHTTTHNSEMYYMEGGHTARTRKHRDLPNKAGPKQGYFPSQAQASMYDAEIQEVGKGR